MRRIRRDRGAARPLPVPGGRLPDGHRRAQRQRQEHAAQGHGGPAARRAGPGPRGRNAGAFIPAAGPAPGYARRYTAEDRRIAEAALERFGVLPLADAFLDSLSGGERQKVYLAMAFAQDAQNLLLDEPTAGLDIRCQLELMQALGQLAAQGRALAVVLHDLDLALQACHRVLLLSQGRILAYGTPEEVYRSGMLARAFGVQVERLSFPPPLALAPFPHSTKTGTPPSAPRFFFAQKRWGNAWFSHPLSFIALNPAARPPSPPLPPTADAAALHPAPRAENPIRRRRRFCRGCRCARR